MNVTKYTDPTIGLGLIDKNHVMRYVGGSGIVVDSKGYFLTATHVLTGLEKKRTEFATLEDNEKRIQTNLAVISYIPRKNRIYSLITNPIKQWVPFELEMEKLDFDIALGWPIEKEIDHPFLKISQRTNFSPLESITMCGYPGGSTTLNPYGTVIDLSLSPAVQEGKISSLMPGNDADTHQGILLDILSTGGSSGSPIIDSENDVVGIAQWIIGGGLIAKAEYEDSSYIFNEKLIETPIKKMAVVKGYAQVGNVFALSSSMFRDTSKAIQQIESGATTITGLNATSAKSVFVKTISNVAP